LNMTRREWLAAAGTLALGSHLQPLLAEAKQNGWPIGMCDWSMGNFTPDVFSLAKRIGLQGVQVSVGTDKNNLWLRQPKVQKKYLQAAEKTGLSICSLGIGELNHVPLMSEPRAALWVADSIKVAKQMGVHRILLPFFSKGELNAENKEDMRRVIEVLRELAPRAEKAGVVLGLESYLSLEGHLEILNAVKSPAVQVYYDIYNSHLTKGYDFERDIKKLGRKRICEVHFKEGSHLLGQNKKIDWPAVVQALRAIEYQGWIVLETSSPSGNLVKDTKKNLAYTRSLLKSSA
jgi:L-ribulose-5-phosphate 3-epimerase